MSRVDTILLFWSLHWIGETRIKVNKDIMISNSNKRYKIKQCEEIGGDRGEMRSFFTWGLPEELTFEQRSESC